MTSILPGLIFQGTGSFCLIASRVLCVPLIPEDYYLSLSPCSWILLESSLLKTVTHTHNTEPLEQHVCFYGAALHSLYTYFVAVSLLWSSYLA
jgi:hypothetical protein